MNGQLAVLALFLFSFFSVSFARINGARSESCYTHSIIHSVTIMGATLTEPSQVCSPCGYALDVVERIEENGQTVSETDPNNFVYHYNTTYRCKF